jgi:hypothetical protein
VGGLVTYGTLIFWISTTFVEYSNPKSLVKKSWWLMFVIATMSALLFVGFGMEQYQNKGVWRESQVDGRLVFAAVPALAFYLAAGIYCLAYVQEK